MKKVFMMLFAASALVIASCGGNKAEKASTNDSDSVATAVAPEVQAAADSLTGALTSSLDSKDAKTVTTTLATLQAKYAELAKEGKLEDAKTYALQIQKFIDEHAEQIKNLAAGNTTITQLVDGIKNLPTSAETTAEQAAAAVSTDAQNIANAAKSAAVNTATGAVDAAKAAAETKVNEAVSGAQQKVNDEVTKAQTKAAEKVNEASKKANDAVNKAAGKALKGLGL